ncbi:serine/threonine protein kinase [Plasmodium falciparum MaliPS096_E11]|uniref:non-specific serine/threonine protein kinase n=1 Tax=Plasmodium falciparum MaliPS096_E11 TaxID=1036727 RepID=A0A024WQA3_PLAFA|nr:serine/threonine protein kinase [Plasmodium falciparum MaliPS096_E11]
MGNFCKYNYMETNRLLYMKCFKCNNSPMYTISKKDEYKKKESWNFVNSLLSRNLILFTLTFLFLNILNCVNYNQYDYPSQHIINNSIRHLSDYSSSNDNLSDEQEYFTTSDDSEEEKKHNEKINKKRKKCKKYKKRRGKLREKKKGKSNLYHNGKNKKNVSNCKKHNINLKNNLNNNNDLLNNNYNISNDCYICEQMTSQNKTKVPYGYYEEIDYIDDDDDDDDSFRNKISNEKIELVNGNSKDKGIYYKNNLGNEKKNDYRTEDQTHLGIELIEEEFKGRNGNLDEENIDYNKERIRENIYHGLEKIEEEIKERMEELIDDGREIENEENREYNNNDIKKRRFDGDQENITSSFERTQKSVKYDSDESEELSEAESNGGIPEQNGYDNEDVVSGSDENSDIEKNTEIEEANGYGSEDNSCATEEGSDSNLEENTEEGIEDGIIGLIQNIFQGSDKEDEEEKEKNNKKKNVYNWESGKKALGKLLSNSDKLSVNNIKYSEWNLERIPTLGFCKEDDRVQEMFKASIMGNNDDSTKEVKFFIKKIPIDIWLKQYKLMNEYDGEYLLDGENFVMEAVASAYLSEHYPGLIPKLYKVVYEPVNNNTNNNNDEKNNKKHSNDKKSKEDNDDMGYHTGDENDIFEDCNDSNSDRPIDGYDHLKKFNDMLTKQLNNNKKGYVVFISELYGQDLFQYINNKNENKETVVSVEEKKKIMKECLKLLIKLHNAGLAHLDISPENILISNNSEFRLCDLAKSAPMYTYNLRHIKGDEKKSFLFQSYQPCIGKLTCMPKECWDIVKEYMRLKIKNPLEYLKSIKNQEERKKFYFDVLSADKYMLGILYIWIWNNNYIWKRADPSKDKIFSHLLNYNMDINSIKLAEDWPKGLKNIINKLLDLESRMKINLDDLVKHPWWFYDE